MGHYPTPSELEPYAFDSETMVDFPIPDLDIHSEVEHAKLDSIGISSDEDLRAELPQGVGIDIPLEFSSPGRLKRVRKAVEFERYSRHKAKVGEADF